MYSQTIKLNKIAVSTPSITLDVTLLKKKIAFSLSILAVGGAMLLMFAILWMPALAILDAALTSALLVSVFFSATAKPVFIVKKAAQFMGVAALGGISAVLCSVLYTVLTFAL
jgi:hypothetical protein